MSLYEDILASGLPFSHHASDLYIQHCPEALEILARHPIDKKNATWFTNECPPYKGQRWIDVPYAYAPFWERRARRASLGSTALVSGVPDNTGEQETTP